MEIRCITRSDDRTAISKIYEESWKYAYQGIVPQEYLDSIPEGRWASHIEREDRKNMVMVEDGRIIYLVQRIPYAGELLKCISSY